MQHARHLGIPSGRNREQVRGHLLGGRPGIHQHSRRASVLEFAITRREIPIDRVADERMHEAQRRLGAQDLGASEGASRRRHVGLVEAGERSDGRDVGGVTEDGDGLGDPNGRVGQAGQAQQHRAGERAGPDLAHRRGAGSRGVDAVGGQRRQELAEEQRVAAGHLVAGGGERGVGIRAETVAHQVGRRGRGQRGRPQHGRRRVLHDLGEQPLVGARLVRADRRDHEHRRPLEPVREIGEEAQRRRVGPVQVVDGKDERAVCGQVERQPVEAVEHREAPGLVVGGLRRRRRPEDGPARRRSPNEGAVPLRPGHGRLKELADDAERKLALELGGAGSQDSAVLGRRPAGRLEQRGLSDAGRGVDHDQPPVPGSRRRDRGVEPFDLATPFVQNPGGHRRASYGRARRASGRLAAQAGSARPAGARGYLPAAWDT